MVKILKIALLIFSFLVITLIFPLNTTGTVNGEDPVAKPNTVNQPAEYKIRVDFHKTVHIKEWIGFLFPPDFQATLKVSNIMGVKYVVEVLQDQSILVKAYSTIEINPSNEGYDHAIFTLPIELGILNPQKPGQYPIQVATQAEPNWVVSGLMIIERQQDLRHGVFIFEFGLKGQNGWYANSGYISFELLTISSLKRNESVIGCYINNERDKTIHGEPLGYNLEKGQYIRDFHYYVYNYESESEWCLYSVKIDSEPPQFVLNGEEKEKIETNQDQFLLQGHISPEILNDRGEIRSCMETISLLINGTNIPIDLENGNFASTLLLQPGENKFHLEAVDQAGNKTEKDITIIRNN
jgi:hypothetical protein